MGPACLHENQDISAAELPPARARGPGPPPGPQPRAPVGGRQVAQRWLGGRAGAGAGVAEGQASPLKGPRTDLPADAWLTLSPSAGGAGHREELGSPVPGEGWRGSVVPELEGLLDTTAGGRAAEPAPFAACTGESNPRVPPTLGRPRLPRPGDSRRAHPPMCGAPQLLAAALPCTRAGSGAALSYNLSKAPEPRRAAPGVRCVRSEAEQTPPSRGRR